VYPIVLPPLRERVDDIPDLARHFLGRCREAVPTAAPVFTPAALALLKAHPWRGNLRELRNCMERLALTCREPQVAEEVIARLLHTSGPTAAAPPHQAPAATSSMRDLERQAVLDALERHHGNRTHAAAALGIGRRTLQNKLRQFGLVGSDGED